MLNFIDISNHQGNFPLATVDADAMICKATEGVGFVDKYCNLNVSIATSVGMPFGFYHFAGNYGATQEADFFIKNTKNYFGQGIPVLDWEGTQSVAWVNEFVRRVHDVTGVWCWIYANPWRFNQGGVEPNCARWVASYPTSKSVGWEDGQSGCPSVDGLVCAWQYTSSGRIDGYRSNLDLNHFYGDKEAWYKYVGKDAVSNEHVEQPEDYLTSVARSVIAGNFGNGEDRKEQLYHYFQDKVNETLSGKSNSAVDTAFANAIIAGEYGNGSDRKNNIYNAVQKRVNEIA